MRVPFIDLKAQYRDVAAQLDPDVHEILSTGAYVLGRHNKGLEAEIAELHGVPHAIAVNSGTDALRIALDACGVGPGDEVLTSAFTFVATIEVIIQAGARPVFVDVEPAAFQMNPELLRAKMTNRTKAIMPVHLFGQMCEMEAINAFAESEGLVVIEDAAQAIGSERNGRAAGRFSRASGFSFYVTKNLGAAGDGGMILTEDAEIDSRCRSLRVHGMGRERYYYDAVGYTSRMAEIQAAVLRAKLTRLAEWTERRQAIAARYDAALAETGVQTPVVLPGNNHTYHQYTVRSRERDALQAFLKEREIDSMIYYPVPLHFHSPYAHLGFGEGDLPETERAAREVLSLPVHPHMSDEEVNWVIESIRAFAVARTG